MIACRRGHGRVYLTGLATFSSTLRARWNVAFCSCSILRTIASIVLGNSTYSPVLANKCNFGDRLKRDWGTLSSFLFLNGFVIPD